MMPRDTTKSSRLDPLARRITRIMALCLVLGLSTPAQATITNAQRLCDVAAATVAAETGVPRLMLEALSRTETGLTRDGVFGPWPWTVNNAGDGRWFDSIEAALAHAERRQADGASNLDIGCFQINLRWHGHAFASLREMFDPLENARYAARFLTGLHREFGSWDAAVAAFHSRTPHFAARYMERYNRIHADLVADGRPMSPAPDRPGARQDGGGHVRAQALDTRTRPALISSRSGPRLFVQGSARPLWEDRP